MSASHDWAAGPAKWAAVVVLGGASIFGLAWSAVTRASGASPPISATKEAPVPAPMEVPRAVEVKPSPAMPEKKAPAEPSGPASRRVNINTASASELELLPGIGPAMAARILDYRAKNGAFRTVDELDEVKGIGPRTLEKLRPLVRVE